MLETIFQIGSHIKLFGVDTVSYGADIAKVILVKIVVSVKEIIVAYYFVAAENIEPEARSYAAFDT